MQCHKVLLCPEGNMNECRPILVWQRKGPEGFFYTHTLLTIGLVDKSGCVNTLCSSALQGCG